MNKFKILNDPIYGFISIPSELIFDIIEHPYFQRLRRISQMGLSYYVYPGAHHTRFEHALGAMHLMKKAILILRNKEIQISDKEEEALLIAILLHDIGHGPFSHTLENSLVTKIGHEEVSLLFMNEFNKIFKGALGLAIEIFRGQYKRQFFNQLVSGQLDIDRLDYLKRDSFYTGVTEGNINAERIISMLNVVNNQLVVEYKGIYSVEKFIVARRLMYWMVYLHKTSVVAESILVNILKRAKELISEGQALQCTENLTYFIQFNQAHAFDSEVLNKFSQIDDYDIIAAIKQWTNHPDKILSQLCKAIIYRKLPKIKIQQEQFAPEIVSKIKERTAKTLGVDKKSIHYFVETGSISNQAYNLNEYAINILYKSGKIRDIIKASDHLNLQSLSKPVLKHFIYYPKGLN